MDLPAGNGNRMTTPMILDASVAAKWFLPGEDLLEEARSVRRAVLDRTIALAAPTVIWSELAHAVVRAARRGRIERDRATLVAVQMFDVRPLIEAIEVEPQATISTALTVGLGAYDAQYLAAAVRRGTAVLTADRRMFDRCRTYGYDTVWLGDISMRDGVLTDTPGGYQ